MGVVSHFIHVNICMFLDSSPASLPKTPLFWLVPHGRYFCHSRENTVQLSLIHAPYKPSTVRQTLMKCGLPKYCHRRRFDGSLIHGLRIMLSSPAVVWQKEILPAVCKDTAINLRGLTATHHGVVFLLYYNRYYWWSICRWCKTEHRLKNYEERKSRKAEWSTRVYFLHIFS